jgi:hypothetical protein
VQALVWKSTRRGFAPVADGLVTAELLNLLFVAAAARQG